MKTDPFINKATRKHNTPAHIRRDIERRKQAIVLQWILFLGCIATAAVLALMEI